SGLSEASAWLWGCFGSGVASAALAGHARRATHSPEPQRTQHRLFVGGFAVAVLVMATGAVTSVVIARDAVGGEWLQLFGLWSIPIAVRLAMILAGLWDTDLARGRRAALVTTTALVGLALTGVIVSVAVG